MPTITPEPTQPTELTAAQWKAEIFRLTNLEREKAGLPILETCSDNLLEAAGIRAQEIVERFEHIRPDGSDCFTVLTDCGVTFQSAGENIAMATTGYLSPAQVMAMWMESSGHRQNILSENFTSLGVGYAQENSCDWFVQLFIG